MTHPWRVARHSPPIPSGFSQRANGAIILGCMAARRYTKWAGNFPPGSPAEWLADGHVTCSIQCRSGECDRRIVDVRLDILPQDQPWSRVSWRLVCRKCGGAGSVNIVPNWHDMIGRAGHSLRVGSLDEVPCVRGHWLGLRNPPRSAVDGPSCVRPRRSRCTTPALQRRDQ